MARSTAGEGTSGVDLNGDSRWVKLTIPAKAEYITLGRLALTGLARLRDLPPETVGDLKLALTEACFFYGLVAGLIAFFL